MSSTEFVKPEVVAAETDGNVFSIIGVISRKLRRIDPKLAKEFQDRATSCESYDKVLQLTHEYVEWR